VSVETALQTLNIPIKKKLSNNRIMTHCFINPEHKDNDPSCTVWLDTGIIYCLGCKSGTHINKVYANKLNISYREAEKIIWGGYNLDPSSIDKNFVSSLKETNSKFEKEYVQEKLFKSLITIPISSIPLYLEIRHWIKEAIDFFNVSLCLSDKYIDYGIFPITSTKLNIYTFEARRIKEYEYLKKIFVGNHSLERLRNRFKKYKEDYKYHISYEYLNKPKVFYPPNAPVTELIYNYDNLDFNQDLIIVEGIPSVGSVWSYLSKNVSSLFGTNLSPEQIKLLRQFKKRIIVVSDNDYASYKFIMNLNKYLDNVFVFDCETEDTNIDFIEVLKGADITKANNFLISRNFLLDLL
jgi:DNA primase